MRVGFAVNRSLGYVVGWLLLVMLLSEVWGAAPVSAARGHEFRLVVGWGVSDGKPEFERCFEACRPGIPGSGKGQFQVPFGVAVNEASGDFYVLDKANGRVERFSAEGEYLGTFNGSGTFEAEGNEEVGAAPPTGTFANPSTIAVDNSCVQLKQNQTECKAKDPSNGDVYVGDFGHEAVDKFTAVGQYIGQVPVPLVGPFLELLGLAVENHGNLWLGEGQGFSHEGFDEFGDNVANEFLKFVNDEGIRFRQPHPGLIVGREGNLFANTVFESPFDEVIRQFSAAGAVLGVLARERSTGVGIESTTGHLYLDNGTSLGRFTPTVPGQLVERLDEGLLVEGAGVAVNSVVVSGMPLREGPVLVADAGAADVIVSPLEAPKIPSIEDVSVSNVTSSSAVLRGVVNPRGAPSEYRLEYEACNSSTECRTTGFNAQVGDGSVGVTLDFEGHTVSVHPQDLSPGTTYHFRLVARNEKNAPGQFVDGSEVMFKTQPAVPVEPRLDNRDWEMVSPAHKEGTLILPISEQDVIQAASDGAAFTFVTDTPTEGEPHGFSNVVQVLAWRTQAGWDSEDLALPHTRATGQSIGAGEEYRFFAEDLSMGLVQPLGAFEAATSPQASEQGPYIRSVLNTEVPCVGDCYRPLVSAGNVPEGVRFGEDASCPPRLICGPLVVGASPDGRHVILRSSVGLTGASEDKGGLYEWSDGQLSLVSVLPGPNGKPASLASGPTLGGDKVTRGAVSANGSRVVWTGRGGTSLYLRNMVDKETVELNENIAGLPVFQAANMDDSKVFFSDGGELYVYETEKDEVRRLTTPVEIGEETQVQGKITGVSSDGSYVYFVADGRLDEAAQAGYGTCRGSSSNEADHCYLYVAHEVNGTWGVPDLVAVLSGGDAPDFATNLVNVASRVSASGDWLTFMSQSALTGYDNRDAVSGVPDEEVFLYSAASNRVVCVSCSPTGARPEGREVKHIVDRLTGVDVWPASAWLAANVPGWTPYELGAAFYQSRYLLDDGRVFFNSSDAIVPGDVNGTADVYEYEPDGVGTCQGWSLTFVETAGGCVGLVSAGTSREESGFLDASASGSDVFFLTASRLVSSDFDSALDVYDAHECTQMSPCLPRPSPVPTPCVTEASCKAPPMQEPELFGPPASAMFTGVGNVILRSTQPPAKPLTRAQLLARMRVLCHRQHLHSKKRRVECERHARRSLQEK